ncbi:MAG: hypothetical protein GQ534_01470 [Candidatus Delongbacteria bacterium]|nr:hypothetical protein [Candidatus Delongbacteria bacterium]
MKKILPLLLAITIIFLGCGGESKKENSVKPAVKKTAKVEKIKLTTERYCMIYKKKDKLLMETYWKQFKGKKYEEVKDIYAQYKEEDKAIDQKYKTGRWDALSAFFRRNFKEIKEYRASDPEYIEYPEYQEAKNLLVDFSFAKAKE